MGERLCSECGKCLTIYNPSHICWACQDKLAEESFKFFEEQYIDVKQMAQILKLSEEQVRRLSSNDRLPPSIPVRRKKLWDKEVIRNWIKTQHKAPLALGRQIETIVRTHGGIHFDDTEGEYVLGERHNISVLTFSKDKNGNVVTEVKNISDVVPVE